MTATAPEALTASTPVPLSSEQRFLLESNCVDVMCQLESLLEKACTFKAAGNFIEANNIANRMLVCLLDFAEANLDGEPLEVVYNELAATYELTQKMVDTVNARSWAAVRRVVGRPTPSQWDVLNVHNEIGEAIAVVTVASLGDGIHRVDATTSIGRQLNESLSSFIDQLRKAW